jgi:drug/metabolite transporter (DMT)-like permease
MPGVVALLAWISGIEKLTMLMAVGISTGLAGVFLVVASNGVDLGGNTTRGDLLMVVAVFCWALYTLGLRRIDPALSPLRVTTITTAVGTPALIAIGLPEVVAQEWAAVPAIAYWGLVYASLLSVVAAYYFWNTGVRRVGASRSAIYSCLIPLAAMAMAWVFLKETPGPMQFIGAALVITGVMLTRRR